MTQLDLFDVPEPARKPARRLPVGVRYVRRDTKTAKRVLCADCTAAIHELGANVAPYPRSARWVRTVNGTDETQLCDPHKQARTEIEGRQR